MKRATLILLVALAACDSGGPADGGAPVQTTQLTGLYQGQVEGGQEARLCMISDPSGAASFGIVTSGPDGSVCSGTGETVREGDTLRLSMAGDEECVIDARLQGSSVTLPADVPEGCAYYCGEGASFAGETFEKTGGTAEDAMRASDLAGDPLCG